MQVAAEEQSITAEEAQYVERSATGARVAYHWVKNLTVGEPFAGPAGAAQMRFARNSIEYFTFIATAAIMLRDEFVEVDEFGFILSIGAKK